MANRGLGVANRGLGVANRGLGMWLTEVWAHMHTD